MGIIKHDLKYSSLKQSYCNSPLSTIYMLTGQNCNFPHLEKLFFFDTAELSKLETKKK